MSREEALEIAANIARGKLSDYLDKDGHIDPAKVVACGPDLDEYTEDTVGAMAVRRKVKLGNRLAAIDRTAKMCGWDKQAVLSGEGITITLNMGEPPDAAPE